jgi:hypothetical protein
MASPPHGPHLDGALLIVAALFEGILIRFDQFSANRFGISCRYIHTALRNAITPD